MSIVLAVVSLVAWPSLGFSIPKLIVLSLGMTLVLVRGMWKKSPRPADLEGPIILFLGAMFISALYSQDRYISFWGVYKDWTHGVFGTALVIAAYFATDTTKSLKPLLFAGSVNGMICGLQALDGVRASGMQGSPIECGAFLAALIPLALAEGALMLVPIGMGLLLTFSRGAWLAALIAVIIVYPCLEKE